jgi:hypothetical protein
LALLSTWLENDELPSDYDRAYDYAARHRWLCRNVSGGTADRARENRLTIPIGFLLTPYSMWQMIVSGLVQGLGIGCTQVSLNLMAFRRCRRTFSPKAPRFRSVMRNPGGSIGISVHGLAIGSAC